MGRRQPEGYKKRRVCEVGQTIESSSKCVQNRSNKRKNIKIGSLAVKKDRFLKEKGEKAAYINADSTKIIQLLFSFFFQGIRRMIKEKYKANAETD